MASRMRGAYRVAGRLMEKIKDPTAREGFKQRQASLQKAIEKVEQRIKEVEDRIRAAEPKNLGGKTDREIRDIAEKLTKGHALEKHFIGEKNFSNLRTREDFQKHVENIIRDPDAVKDLDNGRRAYWSNDGTIVIENPRDPDGGTVFRTSKGIQRFDKLR